MDIKNTDYYLKLLTVVHERNDLNALSIIDIEATVAYGYMNTIYGRLEAKKELFIDKFEKDSDKKNTIASLDRAWFITKNGQEMIKLKRDIQVMETILRTVKNKLIVLSIEKKNL